MFSSNVYIHLMPKPERFKHHSKAEQLPRNVCSWKFQRVKQWGCENDIVYIKYVGNVSHIDFQEFHYYSIVTYDVSSHILTTHSIFVSLSCHESKSQVRRCLQVRSVWHFPRMSYFIMNDIAWIVHKHCVRKTSRFIFLEIVLRLDVLRCEIHSHWYFPLT